MQLTGQHYIDGRWVSRDKGPFISLNPLDNQIIWRGYCAEELEIEAAVEAAHTAFPAWAWLSFEERCQYVKNFAQEVEKHQAALTHLIALETGKPLWEAKTEVTAVINKVQIAIKAYQERTAEQFKIQNEIQTSLTYKPHGVIAVLGPFNFPAHLSNGHIVPALLAGNTIVYKPSELTPATAEFILHCWEACGLPSGVLNGIQGNAQTGASLIAADIQGVFFTGSYAVGKKIHKALSEKPEIIVALEMGGNNPLIVGDIDNVPAAVYSTLLSAFITAGQRCSCARRLFIPQSAQGDLFLSQLIKSSQTLKVGGFTETPEPFMGPVIGHEQAEIHLNTVQHLIKLGGKPILEMHLLKENSGLLSPGIIDMSSVSSTYDEEIFAPLIQVYRYTEFEEAISKANTSRYGLAAGLLSQSLDQYRFFYKHIRAGLINWNRPTTGAVSDLPFGGIGFSGNHRPSAYFASDYCAYPIAGLSQSQLTLPQPFLPGIKLE